MRDEGIDCHHGTVDTAAQRKELQGAFDLVTMMWTVEACSSCVAMMQASHRMLKPGGRVCVVTGSRILVPFKKPLDYYLGPTPADAHCFRFSANTLVGLFAVSGFECATVNEYIDNDLLCMIGVKSDKSSIPWIKDDPDAVADFFERWHRETKDHYLRKPSISPQA
jgi:hypothetical protein